MTNRIRFYSWWIDVFEHGKDWQSPHNNSATQDLANELDTILGNNRKLISMTSAATNGIVVTTIAYEEEEE